MNCDTFHFSYPILPVKAQKLFNSLHPNISMHILHTVLYIFLMVLIRRICLTIKNFQLL